MGSARGSRELASPRVPPPTSCKHRAPWPSPWDVFTGSESLRVVRSWPRCPEECTLITFCLFVLHGGFSLTFK